MASAWFRRMGDIPGLDYEPPVAVDRTSLKHHDDSPELRSFEMDGRVLESLNWNYGESSSSFSPAKQFAFGDADENQPSSVVLQRLWESLELPGEASDYHFAIQRAATFLFARKAEDPDILGWVEYLCWLDIQLVRACPDAVVDEYADLHPGRPSFYSIGAFNQLIRMYSYEGFLQEALSVARIAQEFEQGERDVTSLEERVAALRAEDGC